MLDGGGRAIINFTQSDIDTNRVAFVASAVELGAWSVRDHFSFVVLNGDRGRPHSFARDSPASAAIDAHNDLRFRILISYAFVDETRLDTILERRQTIGVSRGGAVMLNSSHVDVSKLAALADDELLVELVSRPRHGTIEMLRSSSVDETTEDDESTLPTTIGAHIDGDRRALTADALHSGRHLAYRHDGGAASIDNFEIAIVSLRERQKRTARLRVPLVVRIAAVDSSDVVVS